MTYQLVYTKRAVRDIKKLDRVAQKRLKKALEKFARDPVRYAEKLIDLKLGEYRFRIGDYRVIFDLKSSKIIVLCIGHRREIYR